MIIQRCRYAWLAVIVCFGVMAFGAATAFAADLNGKIVTKVVVTGEMEIPEQDIMAVIKTKPGDVLSPDAIRRDMQAIYEMGVFFDVVANFKEVPEGVQVTYTVMENPTVQEVRVKGNTKLKTEEILSMITAPKGKVLNTKALNENARAIERKYHDEGYILAKVNDIAMGEGGVLTVTVSEGTLEGFEVKGNEKTKTYVITREMKLKPGEPFNVKDARRSMQRVYNLGYFQDVNMKMNPGRDPNSIVLQTTVVEQKTGTFSIGGGYSKSDGLVGIIEIGDNNFRGTGDKVKIHWEFGGNADRRYSYEVSYLRPWLDSKQTALGLSYYDMTNEYDDYDPSGHLRSTYDRQRRGFDITLSRPQSEYSTNYLTLRNRTDKHVRYVEGPIDYSKDPQYLKDNFGNTRSIILAHVTDTRDNVFNPTSGNRVSLTGEFAGLFGGDFDYQKFTYEDRRYRKVGGSQVLATRMMLGYGYGDIPQVGQFSLGGADNLRGYEDDQFRGNKMYLASVEYRFPVAKRVQGALFTDIGNAWDGKYDDGGPGVNASLGVGLMVESPIGPIRLDYAVGKDGGKANFSFGGQF